MASRLPVTEIPEYIRLVRLRRLWGFSLSAVMLAAYLVFILLIAFKPALLGTPIAAGSVISIGIPLGLGLIVLAVALTGVYVHLSNTLFDPLTEATLKKAAKK